jgi:hypothetical protein
MRDKHVIRQLTRFLEAVDGFVGAEEHIRSPCASVHLGEGRETETKKNLGGILVSEDFNERGVGVGCTEVIVGDVDRPEEGVVRHHRVEQTVEGGVRGNSLRHREIDGETVPTRCSPHSALYVGRDVPQRSGAKSSGGRPLLLNDVVKVSGERGRVVHRGECS